MPTQPAVQEAVPKQEHLSGSSKNHFSTKFSATHAQLRLVAVLRIVAQAESTGTVYRRMVIDFRPQHPPVFRAKTVGLLPSLQNCCMVAFCRMSPGGEPCRQFQSRTSRVPTSRLTHFRFTPVSDPRHLVYRTLLPDKQSAWLITRYEDVLAVLKDERFGKDRLRAKTSEQIKKQPWIPNMFKPLTRNMLDLDAPDHTRLRGLVQKAFMPRLIENMREGIQALSNELLDAAQAPRADRLGSRLCASDPNNDHR